MALIPTPEDQAIQDQMATQNSAQNPAGTAALSTPVTPAAPAASPAIGSNSTPTQAADAALSLRLNQSAPSSFGAKLSKALDDTPLELNPKTGKPAPGSWSRSLVGAAQVALSGLGDAGAIGKVPPGAGALYGVAKTLQAGNQRQAQMLEEKRKQQAQDEEERRANEQEADRHKKAQYDLAVSNKAQVSQEKIAHELKINDPLIAQGKKTVDLLTDPTGGHAASVAATDIDSNAVKQGVIDGKWNTHDYTMFPTGKQIAGEDENGDPIYRNLYTVVANGGPVKLGDKDADTIKFINDNLGAGDQEIKPGQTFDNIAQFNTVYQRASNNFTALEAKKKALVENGLMEQSDADKVAAVAVRQPILDALAQSHGDVMQAYDTVLQKAAQDPKFAQQAGNIINDFRTFLGTDKDGKSEFDKILEKRQEATADSSGALAEYEKNPDKFSGENANAAIARANAELGNPNIDPKIKARWQSIKLQAEQTHTMTETDKKNLKLADKKNYTGDTTLSGDAYLNSIEDGAARELVRQAGEGNLPLANPGYVLARNPDFLASVALAFPGKFDPAKVTAMTDVYKDFTSKKTAATMISVGTAMKHLKELFDATTPGSFIPGTEAAKKREAALTDASTEIARYLANGNQPAQPEIEKAEKSLSAGITPASWRQGALAQVKLVGEKLQSYQQQWDSAMPSAAFAAHNPMPNIDPDAKAAARYLGVDTAQTAANPNAAAAPKVPNGNNGPTPAVGATKKFPNGNIGVWDGKGWAHQVAAPAAQGQVNQ